ncbi:MAG: hypothetical protein WDW36_006446 [Sanguina aurantia]
MAVLIFVSGVRGLGRGRPVTVAAYNTCVGGDFRPHDLDGAALAQHLQPRKSAPVETITRLTRARCVNTSAEGNNCSIRALAAGVLTLSDNLVASAAARHLAGNNFAAGRRQIAQLCSRPGSSGHGLSPENLRQVGQEASSGEPMSVDILRVLLASMPGTTVAVILAPEGGVIPVQFFGHLTGVLSGDVHVKDIVVLLLMGGHWQVATLGGDLRVHGAHEVKSATPGHEHEVAYIACILAASGLCLTPDIEPAPSHQANIKPCLQQEVETSVPAVGLLPAHGHPTWRKPVCLRFPRVRPVATPLTTELSQEASTHRLHQRDLPQLQATPVLRHSRPPPWIILQQLVAGPRRSAPPMLFVAEASEAAHGANHCGHPRASYKPPPAPITSPTAAPSPATDAATRAAADNPAVAVVHAPPAAPLPEWPTSFPAPGARQAAHSVHPARLDTKPTAPCRHHPLRSLFPTPPCPPFSKVFFTAAAVPGEWRAGRLRRFAPSVAPHRRMERRRKVDESPLDQESREGESSESHTPPNTAGAARVRDATREPPSDDPSASEGAPPGDEPPTVAGRGPTDCNAWAPSDPSRPRSAPGVHADSDTTTASADDAGARSGEDTCSVEDTRAVDEEAQGRNNTGWSRHPMTQAAPPSVPHDHPAPSVTPTTDAPRAPPLLPADPAPLLPRGMDGASDACAGQGKGHTLSGHTRVEHPTHVEEVSQPPAGRHDNPLASPSASTAVHKQRCYTGDRRRRGDHRCGKQARAAAVRSREEGAQRDVARKLRLHKMACGAAGLRWSALSDSSYPLGHPPPRCPPPPAMSRRGEGGKEGPPDPTLLPSSPNPPKKRKNTTKLKVEKKPRLEKDPKVDDRPSTAYTVTKKLNQFGKVQAVTVTIGVLALLLTETYDDASLSSEFAWTRELFAAFSPTNASKPDIRGPAAKIMADLLAGRMATCSQQNISRNLRSHLSQFLALLYPGSTKTQRSRVVNAVSNTRQLSTGLDSLFPRHAATIKSVKTRCLDRSSLHEEAVL